MFDPLQFASFVLACVVIVIVPGPTVTVIVANSLRSGTRAGLLNVAGTQLGMASILLIVAFGLELVVNELAQVFDWIRLLGAAYLVWLGLRLLRSRGDLAGTRAASGGRSYFWQGFVVVWSNPKALLFLGAFIPQFVDPAGDTVLQTLALGATFMAVATLLDGAYAVLAGHAGGWLQHGRIRLLETLSGSLLIAGGLWLALARR